MDCEPKENETLEILQHMIDRDMAEYSDNRKGLDEFLTLIEQGVEDEKKWQIIREIIENTLSYKGNLTSALVADFIPSLIWAHLQSLLKKKSLVRACVEKVLTLLYNDDEAKREVKRFQDSVIEEGNHDLSDSMDKNKLGELFRQELETLTTPLPYFIHALRFFSSSVWNIDAYVSGQGGLMNKLKTIPLSQCLSVYGFLMTFYAYNLKEISTVSLKAACRLCVRISRSGHSCSSFKDPISGGIIPATELETLCQKSSIRVGLSNLFVTRLSFVLLKAVYSGFVDEVKVCVDDLLFVCTIQNLFNASSSLVALKNYIECITDEDLKKSQDCFMLDPRLIKKTVRN